MWERIRLAKQSDIGKPLIDMINNAYKVGEMGILVDTAQEPFHRVTAAELGTLVASQQLLVLEITLLGTIRDDGTVERRAVGPMSTAAVATMVNERDMPSTIVGCIKIERIIQDGDKSVSDPAAAAATTATIKIGAWGCLAVLNHCQRLGFGNRLVRAAEDYMKNDWGCQCVQLDLLAPSHWKHPHKEMLREWYTDRLGYQLCIPDNYEASTERLLQGTALAGRFTLATDADYTTYCKTL